MSVSKKAQKVEEGTFFTSTLNVRKVEYDEANSDFECNNKSEGKPVLVDIDKEFIEGGPAPALLPSKSEEDEINNSGETMGGNGSFSVRRSNRTFKPPDRLGSVPYFWK